MRADAVGSKKRPAEKPSRFSRLAGAPVVLFGLAACLGCGSSEDGGNQAPEVVEVSPTRGTVVAEGRAFAVIMEDPNPDDQLYFRWAIDYPPVDPQATRIFDNEPVSSRERVVFEPDCMTHSLSRDISPHQLTLLVSDRPFVHTGEQASASNETVEQVPADANVVQVRWSFQTSCD